MQERPITVRRHRCGARFVRPVEGARDAAEPITLDGRHGGGPRRVDPAPPRSSRGPATGVPVS